MKLGVEVFFEKHLDLVRGKRVGLITNPTGIDSSLRTTLEQFLAHPDVLLTALFGPEHGVRGDAQAGEFVPFYTDKHSGLPVYSLYGQNLHLPQNPLTNIDAQMRSFDTRSEGKSPEKEMLRDVDILVFDTQDIGTRIYTYIATMAGAMQAATEAGIPFIVLDRPNPINGQVFEGPVLEYPRHSSFIGLYPIPLRHGMTIGELAQFFNETFLPKKTDLTVIRMEGWRRKQWFDETGLSWVLPSPNMPTLDTATVYPGQVILEGTNLSEGRGTTKPFEFFGAPWIDGFSLARDLNSLSPPGAYFREVWFTPTFSKFAGAQCSGCQLHITDRELFRPVSTTLGILQKVKEAYGEQIELHEDYFDKVMGTSRVREAIEQSVPSQEICAGFVPQCQEFGERRKPFLLYD